MSIKTPIIKLSAIQTSHFNLEENQHDLSIEQAASRKLLMLCLLITDIDEHVLSFASYDVR